MEFKWVHPQLFVVEEVSVGFNWNMSKLNFTLNLDMSVAIWILSSCAVFVNNFVFFS